MNANTLKLLALPVLLAGGVVGCSSTAGPTARAAGSTDCCAGAACAVESKPKMLAVASAADCPPCPECPAPPDCPPCPECP